MSYSDLPYVTDVLEEQVCGETCKCENATLYPEKPAKDKRLENWERWMGERKKLQERLGKSLSCPAERLLSNYSEDIRSVNEEKMMFDYTNIPYPHDKYRGNPAFWKMPAALANKCNRKLPSDYFTVMKTEEKCEIPDIEYVRVPDIIKEEKGTLALGYRNPKDAWENLEYRQQRLEALEPEIKYVQPYKPNLNEFFIKGTACITKAAKQQNLKEEFISKSEVVLNESKIPPATIVQYMEFNSVKIVKNAKVTEKIYITFYYDLNSKGIKTKYLDINNSTPFTLRYSLKRCEQFRMFKDILPDPGHNIIFYFDKNEGLIPPNDKIEIPFWFKTKKRGIYKEMWEFSTRPQMWEGQLIIVLEAVATREDLEERCKMIKERIADKMRDGMIQDTVDDLLSKIPQPKNEPVLYTYDKGMIFEAVNQDFSPIVRRPKYLYNKKIIAELEEFYDKVRMPDHPEQWNYIIEDLKNVTKQRDRYNYIQETLRDVAEVKRQDDEKSQQTPVKEKTDQINKEDRTAIEGPDNSLMAQLGDILTKLEQPSVWINVDKNKYEWTYNILRVHIDKICDEIEEVKSSLGLHTPTYYPPLNKIEFPKAYERTKFEFLDAALTGRPKKKIFYGKDDRPAPDTLKDIPPGDIAMRYKVYYGIPDEEPDDKKQKGKKDAKKEAKPKADDKKAAKDKPPEKVKVQEINLKVNEKFDPYAQIEIQSSQEDFPYVSDRSDSDSAQPTFLQSAEEHYKELLYVIFYTYLEKAILKIADVLETQERRKIKLEDLKIVLETNNLIPRPKPLKLINLRKAIAETLQLPYMDTKTAEEEETSKKLGRWSNEILQRKEDGSLWSILRGPRKPDLPDKPISYPEQFLYLTQKNLPRRNFLEVSTIMSNAGIDPSYQDYKEMGVQACYEEITGEEQIEDVYINKNLGADEVENVKEADVEDYACEVCKCDGKPVDQEVFYDEKIPCVGILD